MSIILIYHPQCSACTELLKLVSKDMNVNYINAYEEEIDSRITKVPSIITPDKLLSGKDCFDFIKKYNKPFSVNLNQEMSYMELQPSETNFNSKFMNLNEITDPVINTSTEDVKEGKINECDINDLIKQRDQELPINPR